jgi:hypothetical protein
MPISLLHLCPTSPALHGTPGRQDLYLHLYICRKLPTHNQVCNICDKPYPFEITIGVILTSPSLVAVLIATPSLNMERKYIKTKIL